MRAPDGPVVVVGPTPNDSDVWILFGEPGPSDMALTISREQAFELYSKLALSFAAVAR